MACLTEERRICTTDRLIDVIARSGDEGILGAQVHPEFTRQFQKCADYVPLLTLLSGTKLRVFFDSGGEIEHGNTD